jgi:hypothetical protein
MELHPDEAYYWLYSRLLDWGYFDHPPMVAVFIRLGDSLMHNELGLRLFTVIASSASLYLLWLTLKRYAVKARWFILIVPGILILHIYGFTTTPDAPLFLFTALFYYIYQKYLAEDKLKWALLLAVIIAGLLYSKYHGLLLIIFTVLANIKLFRRPSFYLIIMLSAILYIPHVWWQIQHNYPSINYHLYERSSDTYHLETTLLYLPGQLLMAGPLIGWFLFYLALSVKVKDSFIRCLLVNFIGTVLFFMLSTVKGEVQSHWTLIAFAPLLMLMMIRLKQTGDFPRWFAPLAVINTALIVALRIALIYGPGFIKHSSRFQTYYGYREWARQLHQKAGNHYVIFINGFQDASKYCYYTNSLKGFSYDLCEYRRTQFDIWPIEDSLQHKRALYAMDFKGGSANPASIPTVRGKWYGSWVDDVRTFQRINIQADRDKVNAAPGQSVTLNLTIVNPYNWPISFNNLDAQHQLVMRACFVQNDAVKFPVAAGPDFNAIRLLPGQTAHYRFVFNAPPVKGRYDLVFSIRTDPFSGGRNSRAISFTVE